MTHTGCRGTEGRRLWGKGSVQNEGVGGAIDGRDGTVPTGGAGTLGPDTEVRAAGRVRRAGRPLGCTCTSTDVAVGTRDTRVCTRTHACVQDRGAATHRSPWAHLAVRVPHGTEGAGAWGQR